MILHKNMREREGGYVHVYRDEDRERQVQREYFFLIFVLTVFYGFLFTTNVDWKYF